MKSSTLRVNNRPELFRGHCIVRVPSCLGKLANLVRAFVLKSWFVGFVGASTGALVACRPAVPLVGFSNQDFQSRSIQESADRLLLKGRVLSRCDSIVTSLTGVEVRLVESGIEQPREVAELDSDGRFALRTTRSAVDAGHMMIEVGGTVRVVTVRDIAEGLFVLLPCPTE